MPRAASSRLLRSTLFRVVALNAILLIVSMAAGAIGGWIASRGVVERQARNRVELESASIAHEVREGGLHRAVEVIHSKAERPGAPEYYLIGPDGRTVAGTARNVPREEGWHLIEEPSSDRDEEGEHLIALTRHLADGSILVVGEDMERSDAIRDAVVRAILISAGAALILGIVAGLLATRRTFRQLQRIAATVQAVEAGNLAARIDGPAEPRTDIEELALAINRMLDRIDALVTTIRRVSAEIAHDLRTPLTRVRHAIDKARQQPDGEQRREELAQATAGLDDALRLFNAMLDLAEIDAGKPRAQFEPVDMSELVDRVVDAYRAEIEASRRSITVSVARDITLAGDADLLARAVANLVENALKYSNEAAHIDVSLARLADAVTIMVADDGPGVLESDLAEMMRPFGRLDRARSEPGNGLGLAITDAVARLHRGTLRFVRLQPGLAAEISLPE